MKNEKQFLLLLSHFRQRQYAEALACCSDLIATEPSNTTYYYQQAVCHVALKNWDAAIAALGNANSKEMDKSVELRDTSLLANCQTLHAQIDCEQGRSDEALAILNTVLEEDPTHCVALSTRAKIHLLRHDIQSALADFVRIPKEDSVLLEWTVQFNFGLAYFEDKQYEKALVCFQCAAKTVDTELQVKRYLMMSYYHLNQVDEALALTDVLLQSLTSKEASIIAFNRLMILRKQADQNYRSTDITKHPEGLRQHRDVIHALNEWRIATPADEVKVILASMPDLADLLFYLVEFYPHCLVAAKANPSAADAAIDHLEGWLKFLRDHAGSVFVVNNAEGQNLLHLACKFDNYPVIDWCLKESQQLAVDLLLARDAHKYFPMQYVIIQNQAGSLWEMLDKLSELRLLPSQIKITKENKEYLLRLKQRRFLFWCQSSELAHCAAEYVNDEILSRLVVVGVDMNAKDALTQLSPLGFLAGSTYQTPEKRLQLFQRLVNTVAVDFISPGEDIKVHQVYRKAVESGNTELAVFISQEHEKRCELVGRVLEGFMGELKNPKYHSDFSAFVARWLHTQVQGDWQQVVFLDGKREESRLYELGRNAAISWKSKYVNSTLGNLKIHGHLQEPDYWEKKLIVPLRSGLQSVLFELQVSSDEARALVAAADTSRENSDAMLKRYFVNFFIQSAYCPLMALASGQVMTDVSGVGKSATQVGEAFGAAAAVLDSSGKSKKTEEIPFALPSFSSSTNQLLVSMALFVKDGINLAVYFYKKYSVDQELKQAKRFHDLFEKLHIEDVLLLIQQGISRVIHKYHRQINKIAQGDLPALAEVMVKRIVDYITRTGELKETAATGFTSIFKHAFDNVARQVDNCLNGRQVVVPPSVLKDLDKIFLEALYDIHSTEGNDVTLGLNEPFEGQRKWKALDLFQQPGICAPDGRLYYRSTQDAAVRKILGDFDRRYGYCDGDEEEARVRGLQASQEHGEHLTKVPVVSEVVMLRGGLSSYDSISNQEYSKNQQDFVRFFVDYFFYGYYCSLMAIARKERDVKAPNFLSDILDQVAGSLSVVAGSTTVPGTGISLGNRMIVQTALAVGQYFIDRYERKRAELFKALFDSWDIDEVVLAIKRGAELIAYKYADQINALRDVNIDVKPLAHVAVARIVEYIMQKAEHTKQRQGNWADEITRLFKNAFQGKQIPPFQSIQKPLYELFINGLISNDIRIGEETGINGMNLNVDRGKVVLKPERWIATGVFWWSGVETADGARYRKDKTIKPGQLSYGYCRGDEREVDLRDLKYRTEDAVNTANLTRFLSHLPITTIAVSTVKANDTVIRDDVAIALQAQTLIPSLYLPRSVDQKSRSQAGLFLLYLKLQNASYKVTPMFQSKDQAKPIEVIYTQLALVQVVKVTSTVPDSEGEGKASGMGIPSLAGSFLGGLGGSELHNVKAYRTECTEKETAIDLKALFESRPGSEEPDVIEHIWVEGIAGTGKTTLSKFLVHEWAQGRQLQEISAVIRIPLRDLLAVCQTKTFETEGSVWCWATGWGEQNAIALEGWLTEKDRTLLYVLDGWDEVAEVQHPHFQYWMTIFFSKPKVLVTSRPRAIPSEFRVDRHIRTLGYRPEDIVAYCIRYVKHYAGLTSTVEIDSRITALLQVLDKQERLREIAKTPVLLEMLCWLYLQEGLERLQTADLTYTCLYDYLLKRVLQRAVSSDGVMLEDEAFAVACQPLLDILEEIAYQGMLNGKVKLPYVFIQQSLEQRSIPPVEHSAYVSRLLALGLLHAQAANVDWQKNDYYFTHLSFQEHLAARYFIRQFTATDPTQQSQIILEFKAHKFNPAFEWVWRFAAGLASLQGATAAEACNRYFDLWVEEPRMVWGEYESFLIMQCWDEVGDVPGFRHQPALEKWLIECILCYTDKPYFQADVAAKAFQKTIAQSMKLKRQVKETLLIISASSLPKNYIQTAQLFRVIGFVPVELLKHLLTYFNGEKTDPIRCAIEVFLQLGFTNPIGLLLRVRVKEYIHNLDKILCDLVESKNLETSRYAIEFTARHPVIADVLLESLKSRMEKLSCIVDDILLDQFGSVDAVKLLIHTVKPLVESGERYQRIVDALLECRSIWKRFLARGGYYLSVKEQSIFDALTEYERVSENLIYQVRSLIAMEVKDQCMVYALLSCLVIHSDRGSGNAYQVADMLVKLKLKDEFLVNSLLRYLKVENNYTRIYIIKVLIGLGIKEQDVIDTLLQLQKDKDKYIRKIVAECLGELKIKEPYVIEVLRFLLKDKDRFVCIAASEALVHLEVKESWVINALRRLHHDGPDWSDAPQLLWKLEIRELSVIAAIISSNVKRELVSIFIMFNGGILTSNTQNFENSTRIQMFFTMVKTYIHQALTPYAFAYREKIEESYKSLGLWEWMRASHLPGLSEVKRTDYSERVETVWAKSAECRQTGYFPKCIPVEADGTETSLLQLYQAQQAGMQVASVESKGLSTSENPVIVPVTALGTSTLQTKPAFFGGRETFPQYLLRQTGLISQRVVEDGNCQFRAVAMQLLQLYPARFPDALLTTLRRGDANPGDYRDDESLQARLRALAVVRLREEGIDPNSLDDRDVTGYLDGMRSDRIWGDQRTLAALAKVLGLAIFLLDKRDLNEAVAARMMNEHKIYRPVGMSIDAALPMTQLIIVTYNGHNHYETVSNRPDGRFRTFCEARGIGCEAVAGEMVYEHRP